MLVLSGEGRTDADLHEEALRILARYDLADAIAAAGVRAPAPEQRYSVAFRLRRLPPRGLIRSHYGKAASVPPTAEVLYRQARGKSFSVMDVRHRTE